jgi:lipopolysaccharide transport system ATP-binding protein
MHKKQIEQKIGAIIEFSELQDYIHVPVKKYSSGMQMRLGFAIAIHVDVPILLIDEVLAVGDRDFQKKCLDALQQLKKQENKTIIFISHNEESVKNFCERAILLEHGKIIADGKPKEVFEIYDKT